MQEFSAFKSKSGLVKAIILLGDRVFTGHQDGKIRVWKVTSRNPIIHKRYGSLPTFKDLMKWSVKPKNYVEVWRNKSVLRIKHFDAVSCLSLNEEVGLLYSWCWDRTVKVWRLANSKCLESIVAQDDAINSVVAGLDCLVFSGSADGTVKVWKRELTGKGTKHLVVQLLLNQENAVTALAVNKESAMLYCGSSDGVLNFWERKDQQLIHGGALREHKMAVLCLATSGNLVLSGSADNSICVWRREYGGIHSCVSVLKGHVGPVKAWPLKKIIKHHAMLVVYSGSLDKSVKIWRVTEQVMELKKIRRPAMNEHMKLHCMA